MNYCKYLYRNIAFTSQQTENEIYNRVDENDLDNKYYLTVNARNLFNSKRELERINKDVTDELESTKNLIQQLMKSNRAVQSIINIDQDLKRVRNTRSEEDLVHDSVTEEILKVFFYFHFYKKVKSIFYKRNFLFNYTLMIIK